MINATVVGRLTSDPIVKTVTIGEKAVKVANFTIAANTGFGEHQKTQFVRCGLWRVKAEFAEKYLSKGRLISAKGSLGIRSYIGSSGSPATVLEFIGNDLEVELEDANPNKEAAPEMEAEETAEDPDLPF